jgi:hypothetical protein
MRSTSKKKINANRANSAHSTGPTSAAGKHHSARNAMKHGIFASELFLSDEEKPEFEELSSALRGQFAPTTPMQEIAFGRVARGCWRCRLATRLEMSRLKAHFDLDHAEGASAGQPLETRMPSRWYGSSRSDLQAGKRFLLYLREDLAADGFCHHEHWKDPLIKTCGRQEFYDSLMRLKPEASIDDIRHFDAISEKGRLYKMHVPPEYQPGSEKARVIAESKVNLQTAIRLIDERMQHLEDLARMNVVPGEGSGEGHGGNSLDGITRYFTASTRELERAVKWYQELKEQGL